MAEEEHADHPSSQSGADPAALHAALGAVSEADARDYLRTQGVLADKQVVLVGLQIEDLKREDTLRHWSLVMHHISDVMKVTFQLSVAAIALGFLIVIGAA